MAVRILTGMLLEGLEWLGHAGFRIGVGRASIYIDPYRVSDSEPKADLVLITHQHFDHLDAERLPKILEANPDAKLIVDPGSAPEVEKLGLRYEVASPGCSC